MMQKSKSNKSRSFSSSFSSILIGFILGFSVSSSIAWSLQQQQQQQTDPNMDMGNPHHDDTRAITSITIENKKGNIIDNRPSSRNWIWDQLSESQQEAAMRDVMPYLHQFIAILNQTQPDVWTSHANNHQSKRIGKSDKENDAKFICNVTAFGTKWGAHQLCEWNTNDPINSKIDDDRNATRESHCNFISFGISRDYSFDLDLATRWNCRGFAADPTVVHKSSLHPLITFHNIAATTLETQRQRARKKNRRQQKQQEWITTSIPNVKTFLHLDTIHVLKLDCEGCEYALARDIILQEPSFLQSVQQLTLEVHLNQVFLRGREHLYYWALLLKLLNEADFVLMGSLVGGCGGRMEKVRPIAELYQLNYPGAAKQRPRERRTCHEYLFARVPTIIASTK